MKNTEYLGHMGTDVITGFHGKITGYWIGITGPDRLMLESSDSTGRPCEFWVDIDRVELE